MYLSISGETANWSAVAVGSNRFFDVMPHGEAAVVFVHLGFPDLKVDIEPFSMVP
jgi:hypothetical protein